MFNVDIDFHKNFFLNVKDLLHRSDHNLTVEDNIESSDTLVQALAKAQQSTFDALCDSFNTPIVMTDISELISAYNSVNNPHAPSALKVAMWITAMVNTFGLNGAATPDERIIGWSGISIPEAAVPIVHPLSGLRDELRRKIRASGGISPEDLQITQRVHKFLPENPGADVETYVDIASSFAEKVSTLSSSSSVTKDLLQLCDRLRDVDLWNHGIYLEDRDGGLPALVRPVTRELLTARQEKEERELQKQRAKEEREREATARADKGRLNHLDMFRTSEYSAWDDEGLPLKDAQGDEVTKSKGKKLRKDWERQKKLHEAWVKSNP